MRLTATTTHTLFPPTLTWNFHSPFSMKAIASCWAIFQAFVA